MNSFGLSFWNSVLKIFLFVLLILIILIPLFVLLHFIWFVKKNIKRQKKRIQEEFLQDSRLKTNFQNRTNLLDRQILYKETTFHNFHFHAADQGFLRIGGFLMQWGMGGHWGDNRQRRNGYLPTPYAIDDALQSVVCLPFIGGSKGRYSLRVRRLRATHFALSDAQRCETPYLFLTMGLGFSRYTMDQKNIAWDSRVRITYNEGELDDLPPEIFNRLKFMASTKVANVRQRHRNIRGSCSGGPLFGYNDPSLESHND